MWTTIIGAIVLCWFLSKAIAEIDQWRYERVMRMFECRPLDTVPHTVRRSPNIVDRIGPWGPRWGQ